jgi:hypothetical protein
MENIPVAMQSIHPAILPASPLINLPMSCLPPGLLTDDAYLYTATSGSVPALEKVNFLGVLEADTLSPSHCLAPGASCCTDPGTLLSEALGSRGSSDMSMGRSLQTR